VDEFAKLRDRELRNLPPRLRKLSETVDCSEQTSDDNFCDKG